MYHYNSSSKVEAYFQKLDPTFGDNLASCKINVLTTQNYIVLGQLTALRFLEWVCLNPEGVVALPTGKTPEFFIKWIQHYLDNWEFEVEKGLLKEIGINYPKPNFKGLHFFQLDEFFPINPEHERSFRYFVKKYYIDVMGFDPEKTHLINTYFLNSQEKEMLGGANNLSEIFIDGKIDLSLRIRQPQNKDEEMRKRAIKLFDEFCMRYEQKIRDLGGIGFFLGGIGPDGHIAFNVKGSSHFSHTRLTGLNYESQAAAAGDLGGIELVRKKAVITMGLETITYNPDCVAVIIAAGQSKAEVVAGSLLNDKTQAFPATVLQKLPYARFFITSSAAFLLPKSGKYLSDQYPNVLQKDAFTDNLVVNDILATGKTIKELIETKYSSETLELVAGLKGESVAEVLQNLYKSIERKIEKGIKLPEDQVILHTGPHHDDIELGYFPLLHHLVRSVRLKNHFAYCTSGYTSVTSEYLRSIYVEMEKRLDGHTLALREQKIESAFTTTYDNDITLYLRGIAQQEETVQHFAVARRLARKWMQHLGISYMDELKNFVRKQMQEIDKIESGRKEPETFHLAKAWLREFEAELVWAHFGFGTDRVNHLRLPFYSDDIFPHYPDFESDVKPILQLLESVKPTIVSLALDPEGSGPDTHFKTLIALSQAIDAYHENHPEIDLHVWGYRNVWSQFEIGDVNTIVPISLNSFAVLKTMFNSCFLSQRNADFPSYRHNGAFSELAQKNWVAQHSDICKLLGEDYFYNAGTMMMRRTYGSIYIKDMSYEEFRQYMIPVKHLLEIKANVKD
ncbi:MAG: glucosamine-6-phosphate deaminase [Bacteroidales bacterium]|nr:glucosamine-6-phosphate deaminase [Bacteroidales bacterium]